MLRGAEKQPRRHLGRPRSEVEPPDLGIRELLASHAGKLDHPSVQYRPAV